MYLKHIKRLDLFLLNIINIPFYIEYNNQNNGRMTRHYSTLIIQNTHSNVLVFLFVGKKKYSNKVWVN